MNIKHKNIRHYVLVCSMLFAGSLLFCKDSKIVKSKKQIQTTEKYTINTWGYINSVVDYNIDTSLIENVVANPDVAFEHTDYDMDIDIETNPQINYLGDSVNYANYSVESKGTKLTYLRNDTVLFVRENGTLPWRNNNPGALKYTEFTKKYGAIGRGNRDFAVFPTREAGIVALKALLQSDLYKKLKLSRAIKIFAPDTENDTEAYKRRINRLTGVRLNKRLYELNNDEFERVVMAIIRLEGFVPGKETIFVPDTNDNIMDTILHQQNIKTL